MTKFLTVFIIFTSISFGAHAIDVSNCEKISETGTAGDWIVKCSPTDELRKIQLSEATCMFMSAESNKITFDEMLADTDNIYINIVPDEFGPSTIGYRIMQNTKFNFANPQPYAVCIK